MTESEPPAVETVVREHLEICSRLHELLLEENRVMRTGGALPPEELMERKRAFLPLLDVSLERLRALEAGGVRLRGEAATVVTEARKRLMQMLMLDRENERLLLKASLPPQMRAAYAPVIPGQVARAYQKHAKQSGAPTHEA
ncbi:hypothetical protein ASA1KI_09540 [Opitutales bacterium ASA1]|uniref:hypothetical protein n=1 Tax=Congregicoccus parvus TaxID=3081749 RepID=UPI002B304F4C|nr:hypothetical protein ASA1KI_09540 [Opitutales bacterium ASA1]